MKAIGGYALSKGDEQKFAVTIPIFHKYLNRNNCKNILKKS